MLSLAALGLGDLLGLPVASVEGQQSGNERSYPIPAADGVNIDRTAQVILVRFEGKAYAMALACPHENAAVKWIAKDHRFQCTRHDSQYTPQGTYTSGRATRNMDRFPIRRSGDALVVTVDRVHHSDADPAGWAAAHVDLGG